MGIEFNIRNILKIPQCIKIAELILTLICMLLTRVGNAHIGSDVDSNFLGGFIIYGYFFISIVQVISILYGEKSPVMEVLFALCGFCFYIGFGANGAANKPYPFGDEQKALVAICIIASLSFLVDFVFGIINLKNEK